MTTARFSARVLTDGSFRRPHLTLCHVSGRRPSADVFRRLRLPPVEMNIHDLPKGVKLLSHGPLHMFEVQLC